MKMFLWLNPVRWKKYNMSKSSFKTLGQSLNTLLNQLGVEKKVKSYQIIDLWPDIVGEKISKISKAERVFEKILYVKVKGTTWRTELLFHKMDIIHHFEQLCQK